MPDELSWYPEHEWSLDAEWYEVTSSATLRQCDILLACPVLRLDSTLHWPLEPSKALPIKIETYDSIILTQSCDLENRKIEDVLLAQVIAWPTLVRQELQRNNQIVKKRDFRKALIEGKHSCISTRASPVWTGRSSAFREFIRSRRVSSNSSH